MSNCKKMPYFEGLQDETIKQGSAFDLTEGVRAFDGDDQEITYTYSPTNDEFDTCAVGSYTIQYHASQTADKMLPNMCIPGGLALTTPRYCDDYESTKAKRTIKIIRASNPQILGIPHVTIAKNATLDVLNGVSAVDDNGNPIADISYSGTLDKQVSGNIASITDGQSVVPVKSLKVTLEPIQDLHGYDKPWSGGAGRNLLNIGGRVNQTSAEVKYTSDDNYIILNGTKNGGGYATMGNLTLTLPAGTYYAKAFVISGTTTGTIDVYVNNGTADITGSLIGSSERTITLESETTLRFRFAVWSDGTVLTNYTVGIVISKTSGIDKFYPYSNLCPISGHTECVTHRTGVNVWDEEWEIGALDTTTGLPIEDSGCYRAKNFIPVKPSTAYYFNFANSRAVFYDADKQFVESPAGIGGTAYTTKANVYYAKFYRRVSPTVYSGDLSINYPSTDHDYHAYDGTTYTTTLGRTVYGGTLDVVSGELTVDWAMMVLDGSEPWVKSSSYNGNYYFAVGEKVRSDAYPKNGTLNIVTSNGLKPVETATELGNNDLCILIDGGYYPNINIKNTSKGTLEDFKAWLADNPLQVVYELATPQTYQLDPQTIALLHGNNNVWSDGEVTVVYSLEIPTDGEVSYPLEGEYEITYSATDKCGNVGEAIRQITVE